MAVLERVPASPDIWRELGTRFPTDVFCGLFLNDWNRGTELSAQLLERLAERGLSLSIDIYCNPGGSAL